MRRLLTLIVMLVVPLQFAWSAALEMHGHLENGEVTAGAHAHAHDHEHPDDAHACHHASAESDADHGQDGHHHHCHCHPAFSAVLMESGLPLDATVSAGPRLPPPAGFLSHTPPLLDRPPLAHA